MGSVELTCGPRLNMEIKLKTKRRIAPRLYNGDCRVNIGHGLPPRIKSALKLIAQDENESVLWVLEKVIIDYFNMKEPRYKGQNGKAI